MPDGTQPQLESNIEPIEIQEEMERSFLDYAMSVITSRALPDARDGLKPVQRRILYGMYEGGLRPERNYKKCASAVGDVMGKYHPHGDQSIYDALARMAQDFSLRYPLVDGHGNFGSPDPNDRPAAMRYCLSGSSRVRTVDSTIRIDDLVDAAPSSETPIDLKVLDREGNPVRATKFFHSGDHPTLRLRTREGYELTGTHNHPVLCLEQIAGVPVLQWKLLEEIEPGATVVISRAVDASRVEATAEEASLAFLAGALIAEGWTATCTGFGNSDSDFFFAVLAAFDAHVLHRTPRVEILEVRPELLAIRHPRHEGSRGVLAGRAGRAEERRQAHPGVRVARAARREAGLPPVPVRGRRLLLLAAAATRSRSRTPRAASNSPVTCSGSCSSSA